MEEEEFVCFWLIAASAHELATDAFSAQAAMCRSKVRCLSVIVLSTVSEGNHGIGEPTRTTFGQVC